MGLQYKYSENSIFKNNKNTFLSINNICLNYGSLDALKNINLNINRAEVHALVGEHGAGKSSLAHVISGFIKPHSGKIYFNNRCFDCLTQEIARKNGIEMITQQNPLFEQFSVAENIIINNKTGLFPLITHNSSIKKAGDFLKKLNFPIDPAANLKNLNLSDKVLIDIIKHLYLNPELLILDEALEKLSNENLKKILLVLNDLKEKGLSILFITHRIDDIYNFADKVTIIQNGKILITDSIDNIDKISLIKLAYTHMLVEKENNSDENFYQALKYNEAILTDLPVNLVVIDKNYKIKLVNKYAKTFFVFKNKQYKDMSFREIIPKGNKKFFKLIQDAVTKKKQMTFYQIPLTLCNSKTINNIVVYPIFDVDILIGFIIIINDITKQEKLREQITLSENLASVGLLAAGVAHEINNPLDIMSYYLEHIRFNSRDKEIQDAVHNLYEEINSIAQIVSNLITFSDKKEMSKEKFNIISLINSLIGLIEHKAEKNNITIIMNSPQEALYIEANRNEIKQVFLNIVKNSFEAMTDGGILTITISGIHYNENSNLEIIIDDTGSGIKKTDIKDIFLPFYSTRYGSDKNSGLGLSISYRIIEKYNGLITVKNKRKGCQFKIILPICT